MEIDLEFFNVDVQEYFSSVSFFFYIKGRIRLSIWLLQPYKKWLTKPQQMLHTLGPHPVARSEDFKLGSSQTYFLPSQHAYLRVRSLKTTHSAHTGYFLACHGTFKRGVRSKFPIFVHLCIKVCRHSWPVDKSGVKRSKVVPVSGTTFDHFWPELELLSKLFFKVVSGILGQT